MHINNRTIRRTLTHLQARTRADVAAGSLTGIAAMMLAIWLLAVLNVANGRLALAALLTVLTAGAIVGHPRRRPRLRVLYRGEPLTVNENAIQPHMEVPGTGGPCGYENFGGPCAAVLFTTAVSHGAVKVPDEIHVECFANGEDGCDVMLTATARDGYGRVSTGWIDSATFGVDYSEEANDPQAVASALTFLVASLNAALHPAA